MARIPVNLRPPSAPVGPFADPGTFGTTGAALQNFGAIIQDEADQRLAEHEEEIERRNRQRQAVELAGLRAQAQNGIGDFLQEIERDPDFSTYGQRWQEQQEQLQQSLQASVSDPVVWDAFQADWVALSGSATRAVRDFAYDRESDHFTAELGRSNNAILDRAGTVGANAANDLAMIEGNYLEAFRSGLISETDAVEFIRRDTQAYALQAEQAEQDRDPIGWYLRHTEGTPDDPSAVTVGPAPGDAAPADPEFAPEAIGNADLAGVNGSITDALARAGATLGFRLQITSGHRTQEHQDALLAQDIAANGGQPSGRVARHSRHTDGMAVDISTAGMSEDDKARMVAALIDVGFTAFGEYDGHIHADFRDTHQRWTSFSPAVEAILEERGAVPGAGSGDIQRAGPVPVATPGVAPDRQGPLFRRGERLAEDALEEERLRLDLEIADYETALINGIEAEPPPDDRIRFAYLTDPSAGAEIIRGLRRAERLSDEIADMHDLRTSDIQALIAAEEAAFRQGGPNLTERGERLEVLRQAATAITEAREDSAGYVVGRDEELAASFESAQTPDQWAAAIDLSMQRQLEFVDRPEDARPLPDNIVSAVLGAYEEQPDAVGRLRALQVVTLGHRHGAAVFDQLEATGLDPALRWIVDATAREHAPLSDAQAADLMAIVADADRLQEEFDRRYEGETERREANAVPGAEYDERRGVVHANRMSIVGDIGGTTALIQAERETLTRAAIGLALRNAGASTPDIDSATDTAYAMLFGGTQAIDTELGQALVPTDGSGSRDDPGFLIQRGMRTVLDNLTEMMSPEALAPFLGIAPELLASEEMRFQVAQIVEDAQWVNFDDGYALAMPVGGQFGRLLPAPDGSPRVWTGEWLADAGNRTIPAAIRPEELPALDAGELSSRLSGAFPGFVAEEEPPTPANRISSASGREAISRPPPQPTEEELRGRLRQRFQPLAPGQGVRAPDGTFAAASLATVPIEGFWYNVPTQWVGPDGRIIEVDEDTAGILARSYFNTDALVLQRFDTAMAAIHARGRPPAPPTPGNPPRPRRRPGGVMLRPLEPDEPR